MKGLKKLQLISTLLVVLSFILAACQGSSNNSGVPNTGNNPSGNNSNGAAATQAAPAGQATSAAPGNAPQAYTGPVKNSDTLIEATISDPESLDPAWAYDTASGEVIFNVYETLLFPKKGSTTDFVPMLATKWDVSQDGKTYTFHIRPGVKFHDGSTLTPEDVAYSFWRGMIQDRAGGPQWIMLEPFFGLSVQTFADDVVKAQFNNDFTKAAQAVEQAITFDNNAGTVTFHLKQPYGPMLQILSGTWAGIVSKQWVIKQGGWDGDPAKAKQFHDPAAEKDELFNKMNGTGPYKFDRWAPGQEIDLSANTSYWAQQPLWPGGPSGAPKVSRVVIKYISEWGTRFAQFQTGDVDISYVDTQYISQVQPLVGEQCDANSNCNAASNSNGPIRVFQNLPSVEQSTIFLNEKVNTTGGQPQSLGSGKLDGNGIPATFFADINIRKAFNYCFDWNTYIQQAYNSEAIQVYGPIIKGELGFDPNQTHFSFDLTKCADSFKASTLKSADGKSLWDTGFYMQFTYNTGNDQRKVAGQILAQSLLKVNPKFHMAIVDEPFALILQDQTSGRLPIFMIGWLEDYHDPQDWVGPYLATGGTYGGTQSFDPTVQKQMDQLIQQGATSNDQAARAKIYAQLNNLAYQNALDIFVVQPELRVYMQRWVKGYYYNPTYPGFYFYSMSKAGG